MNVYEKAKEYYPRLWSKERLKKLVEAGHLSVKEYKEIVGEDK